MTEPCLPLINDSVIVNCFYGNGSRFEGDRPVFIMGTGRWSARCNYTRPQAEMGNISANVHEIGSICSMETGMILYKNMINN